MLNDEPGNIFRERAAAGFEERSQREDRSVRILIVDPVLGSRFSLAQAVTEPGCQVQTASTVEDALCQLRQSEFSLIIVDQQLAECDGIEFLVEVRGLYPAVRRVLVTASESISFIRDAIGRARLCFLLSKPWNPGSLRRTIREVLRGERETGPGFEGWDRVIGRAATIPAQRVELQQPDRNCEVLLRGLLAGLNSCEFESEVFELLHSELARPFRISEWLWVDEERGIATRIAGDWPVERGVSLDALDAVTRTLLSKAHESHRVMHLDDERLDRPSNPPRAVCIGLTLREEASRTRSCLIWADVRYRGPLVSMMRELQTGLEIVFRRLRLADARAQAARRLAQHVSDELRTPVGALAHAIDRLRGEAVRAGLSTKWVDRVSSESDRVVRAVEQLEGEMRMDEPRSRGTTG